MPTGPGPHPLGKESSMSEVKTGDTVRIHYTGTLADGSTFDSSDGRAPLQFTVGSGQIIRGLDAAIPGMTVGERKVVEVPCAEAYGDRKPEALQAVPRSNIPEGVPVDPGTRLQMKTREGREIGVIVVSADDETVTLDANHPLAGKDLTFAIELVEVV